MEVIRRNNGAARRRRKATRVERPAPVDPAPVGGSVEVLSYATVDRGPGYAHCNTVAGPAVADTGSAFYGKRDGGKRRQSKRDRHATPTHAAKGRNRGGVHGKGPPGWCGQRTSIQTSPSVLDKQRGDRRIKDMTGFALRGGR